MEFNLGPGVGGVQPGSCLAGLRGGFLEEVASVLAMWMATPGAQRQRGHSGVGAVSIGRFRAVWGNLEKEFWAQGRHCWELGQLLKDSEDLVGWASGTPSKWAARPQPAAWARMACFSVHSDPGQGFFCPCPPFLLASGMFPRQSSSPIFRAVIQ